MSSSPAPLAPAPLQLPDPADVGVHSLLQQAVLATDDAITPENTLKAMEPKEKEYIEYCNKAYPNDLHRHTLKYEKVYKFMVYQSFREQKPRGGPKALRNSGVRFDYELYKSMLKEIVLPESGQLITPTPKRPIGIATFDMYRAVFRRMHRNQLAQNVTGEHWEAVWKEGLVELRKHVQRRAPRIKKETYQEKVSGEFAPFSIVERYNEIELEMWKDSAAPSIRQIATNLRHRYCLLHLTSGILRCESLYRAELSDFVGLNPPKQDSDVHQVFIMINQIAAGKTNHGRVLYGRAIRHRKVELCCIGALSFYLSYRFMITEEFEAFTAQDWMDNEKWFDIKLLIDVQRNGSGDINNTNSITNDSYSAHIKRVLAKLHIGCNKLLHLGRNMGARILELVEEEAEAIRQMGQWNPSVFDNSYSAKLPLGPMRKLAGYPSTSKIYFNTRTTVMPCEKLLRATPIGGWVYDALDALECEDKNKEHTTAYHVLKFFQDLNIIFLQDAAALMALHSDRSHHPMFLQMPVFYTDEFKTFQETMASSLDSEEDPLDANVEKILPGISRWHSVTHTELTAIHKALRDLTAHIEGRFEAAEEANVKAREDSERNIARVFAEVALKLVNKSPLQPPPPASTRDVYQLAVAKQTTQLHDQGKASAPTPAVEELAPLMMKKQHESLHDMWNEWHGEGPFAGNGGGVVRRNELFGKKWRKELKINDAFYSRTARIITMLKSRIPAYNGSIQSMLDDTNLLYLECGRHLSTMVIRCQELGYIPKKKPRGKKRPSSEICD